jgi:hypothetical protein
LSFAETELATRMKKAAIAALVGDIMIPLIGALHC